MDGIRLNEVCKNYFHIEKPKSAVEGLLLTGKIISYATIILPIVFIALTAISQGLMNRQFRVNSPDAPSEKSVQDIAKNQNIIPALRNSDADVVKDEVSDEIPFQKIREIQRSDLKDHLFESIFPQKPVEGNFINSDGQESGFQHFQINCNGGEVAFHEQFGCFEGPQIARYNPEGTQYGALLSRIQLTPEMASKLPNLPNEIANRPITDAFVTIWGNLPDKQDDVGGGEHLMFRPQTLVGQIPNGYGKLGKGLYPLNIGMFTSANGGIIPIERSKDHKDLPTGLAVNNKLQRCQYDCHGENDDPSKNIEDNIYLTSVMGTFDLDNKQVHAFTVVATLDPQEEQYLDFKDINKTMASYQIVLSDELTKQLAPLFHTAQNLRELLQGLHVFAAQLNANDRDTPMLKQAVRHLIHIFSED